MAVEIVNQLNCLYPMQPCTLNIFHSFVHSTATRLAQLKVVLGGYYVTLKIKLIYNITYV